MRAWSYPILWWISNYLATVKGRELGGVVNWPFYYAEILCRISVIRLGDYLLRSPHLWNTFCGLFHVASLFGHWNTWVVSSDRWPHPLGEFSEVQAPHFDMMVPIGTCFAENLASHLGRGLGAFFVARHRSPQSTRWLVQYLSVAILSQSAISGGEYIAMSIFELRLVETSDPRGRIFFPWERDWYIIVKSPELILNIVWGVKSLGVFLVLRPSSLCRMVTFYIKWSSSVEGAKLLVLMAFDMSPLPLDWWVLDIRICCWEHVKVVGTSREVVLSIHRHYYDIESVTGIWYLPLFTYVFFT